MLKALVTLLALPGVVAFAAPFALVAGRHPDPQTAI